MGETLVATSSAFAFEDHLLSQDVSQTLLDCSAAAPAAVQATTPTKRSPIENLPTELHLLIMARLDPLDRTMLGLTSHKFYSTWQMTLPRILPSASYPGGSPPQCITRMPQSLRTRRIGKNKQEWAYNKNVQGFKECRFCGVDRCQLWRHLDELFPTEQWEFCGVRERFAPRVKGEHHDEGCWRSCPPVPRRCGRHGSVSVQPIGELSKL